MALTSSGRFTCGPGPAWSSCAPGAVPVRQRRAWARRTQSLAAVLAEQHGGSAHPEVAQQQTGAGRREALLQLAALGMCSAGAARPACAAMTVFEKRELVCSSTRELLLDAPRTIAEINLCSLDPSACDVAVSSGATVRQHAQAMAQAAGVLRESVPSLAARARALQPAPAAPQQPAQQDSGAENTSNTEDAALRWSSTVTELQGQVDIALAQLQAQAQLLVNDPAAPSADRLAAYAESIARSRLLLARLHIMAGERV